MAVDALQRSAVQRGVWQFAKLQRERELVHAVLRD
jgi:hypothetical protein